MGMVVELSRQASEGRAKAVTEAAAGKAIYISAISAWEIALLSSSAISFHNGCSGLDREIGITPFLNFVPVDNAIAVRSVRLREPFHKDPADRIIVATAVTLGASVVTSDSKILKYSHVKSIWK